MKFFTSILTSFCLFAFISLFYSQTTQADHLIGGELSYKCLGNDYFEVTLKIYRDCATTQGAPFDSVAAIYLRDPLNEQYLLYKDSFAVVVPLIVEDTTRLYDTNANCVVAFNPCVSVASYRVNLNLPPRTRGYELVHQRCCRTGSLTNILNSHETGGTYTIVIPHETDSDCENNSPVFNNPVPIFQCVDEPIEFDYSATDLDGDSLVYSLCHPTSGASTMCPGNPVFTDNGELFFNFCPGSNDDTGELVPMSFGSVLWLPTFSTDNPLGNSDNPLTIDPQTGMLSGIPDALGRFVVGVCVSEYRNGELIGTKMRDFELKVKICNSIIPEFSLATYSGGDFIFQVCPGEPVIFSNNGNPNYEYFYDFGEIDGEVLTFNEQAPIVTYEELGTYQVDFLFAGYNDCEFSKTIDIVVGENCLGIETPAQYGFRAFPNPMNESLSLEYTLPKPANVKVVLYNQLGQEMLLSEGRIETGNQQFTYPIDLAKGIYFLTVFFDEEIIYSEKMVKMN